MSDQGRLPLGLASVTLLDDGNRMSLMFENSVQASRFAAFMQRAGMGIVRQYGDRLIIEKS